MAKIGCQIQRLIPLAVVVALAVQSQLLAQKVDWSAEELAQPFPEAATEDQLIEQLRSAPDEGKAIACKQLSIYGTKAAVPELAKLLGNEQLASWSRVALEAIPDPAAEQALIDAAGKLQGKLLVGTINSIGVKRSEMAVNELSKRLRDPESQVAAAAAVALGKIGNEQATSNLQRSLAAADEDVRSAAAEGCVLCAERLMAEGKSDKAAELYEAVRQASVPKQRLVEATRGAILARGDAGIPLLVEQLKSDDKAMFQIALNTARELSGNAIIESLAAELSNSAPERASLIIYTIGDRKGVALPPAVVRAASGGDQRVRLAAVQVLGKAGDAAAVPTLLEAARDSDAELSAAAKTALAALPGKKVDREIASRLANADGNEFGVLIELVGERRINATPELVKALDSSDAAVRNAAIAALGETVSADELEVLVSELIEAKADSDREIAEKALLAASIRMPKREATAAELASAMTRAPAAAKPALIRILGAMGGPTALEMIAEAIKSGDDPLQDAGTRVLGQWMTPDAAPVLLEISQDSANKKYQVRALRGYLRIARQLKQLPDEQRVAMARQALKIAERDEERELALDVLKRCPSAESVELASSLVDDAALRDRAVETAIYIAEQIKDKDPAAAKSAGEKALKTSPPKELADRARALTAP